MTTEVTTVKSGRIDEYFDIEDMILSNGTADAFRAVVKGDNERVILWCTRSSMLGNDSEINNFHYNIKLFQQMTSIVPLIEAAGVDCNGVGFAALARLDGDSLKIHSTDGVEIERRVTSSINLIVRLHQAGVYLGNISDDSFWVFRNGEVKFVGVVGGVFDRSSAPDSVLPYLAPEITKDITITPAQDVYSLGVLTYYLFTERYPFGSAGDYKRGSIRDKVIPPSTIGCEIAPSWLLEVASKACAKEPADRYQSVGEMMEDITRYRARAFEDKRAPSTSVSALTVAGQPHDGVHTHKPETEKSKSAIVNAYRAFMRAPFALKALLVFALLAAGSFYAIQNMVETNVRSSDELRRELAPLRSAALDDDIKRAIDILAEPSVPSEQKRAELHKLIASNDPLSHSILLETAIHAPTRSEQVFAERAIIERLRTNGFKRTATQMAVWLGALGNTVDMVGYEAMLKAVDPLAPADARKSALRVSYQSFPKSSLMIAAALAFDLKDGMEQMRPVLATLAADAYELTEAEKHSALAIVLASPDLAIMYSEEIIDREKEISNEDLLWAQGYIAGRNEALAQTIASIVLEREMLVPLRMEFLKILVNRGTSAQGIGGSLIRAAAGKASREDVVNLGSWYDKHGERALFLICADPDVDNELKAQALDALAGRGLTSEPGVSLMKWIRKDYWEERHRFAYAIGVLATYDIQDQKNIDEAFIALDEGIKNSDLVPILLETSSPEILISLIKNYEDVLGLGILLNLLDHKDKKVRIQAVKALRQYNDVGALKLIIDHYRQEDDPEVKEVYRENFWVIRDREAKNGKK